MRSWMSPPTLLALGTGQAGILLRLGDHTTAVLSLTRGIGVLIIAVMVGWLLVAVWRGRLHPWAGWAWRWRHGPAVPGGAAVVSAVGDHPAGCLGDPPRLPGGGDRRHDRRRCLRPDGQRRPFRVVPNRGRHTGQYRDRGAADRHDLHALAVAPTADRHSRAPSRGGD
ncbi:hypothetical protein I552_5736 [Mycobacterium xenopi 3993]|nr:hypothetical protein I552_5736 [Mycobacterium xenopi 3993]